jgi:histidinol-phosphate phosphatase family protein
MTVQAGWIIGSVSPSAPDQALLLNIFSTSPPRVSSGAWWLADRNVSDTTDGAGRRPTQAVILAGGRGSRLRPLTDTRPKAMVEFHGKPFLEYLIEMLRDQGFERVLLLLGYMADAVVEHFGDGRRLGVDIDYEVTPPEYETSQRVERAQVKIDECFLLMYCDNYWPMRIDHMWAEFVASGAPAQITVYANRDRYSRSSVKIGPRGMVQVLDRSRTTPRLEGVEISYAILEKSAVVGLLPGRREPFESAVYPALAAQGRLHAYWTEHRYYSVGGHDRLEITREFLARRPAIILDRDVVLNVGPHRAQYGTFSHDFRWLDGSREALRLLCDAGYRVIIVCSQADIGRGGMQELAFHSVDRRMRSEALAAGGRIDAVYYHGLHTGADGYSCPPSKPGVLFQAQREHHLDLTRTFFVGDDEYRLRAACVAGCRSARVSGAQSLLDITRRLVTGTLQESRPF